MKKDSKSNYKIYKITLYASFKFFISSSRYEKLDPEFVLSPCARVNMKNFLVNSTASAASASSLFLFFSFDFLILWYGIGTPLKGCCHQRVKTKENLLLSSVPKSTGILPCRQSAVRTLAVRITFSMFFPLLSCLVFPTYDNDLKIDLTLATITITTVLFCVVVGPKIDTITGKRITVILFHILQHLR